ncbi:MAG: L-aspartate oxidase [Bacteroidota bacterium]|jgi:L-aspartate oxidase
MQHQTDFLVIGSGIAGLTFALKVAEQGRVTVITKASSDETNTKYAQGGVAAVTYSPDSIGKHIEDTLSAGDGLCDREVVHTVITEGVERVRELIDWGAEFDRDDSGRFDLAREGGHSEPRVLHYKDKTGAEMERALLQRVADHPNIVIHTHLFAIDLITQHHLGQEVRRGMPGLQCFGAYVLNLSTRRVETWRSRTTLVCTGGSGQVYSVTTNPLIATGDGVAMVYRAKGTVADMEFMQFHPTGLYQPGKTPCFLISEAVRGAGAVIRNLAGEDFMPNYHSMGSLAPRDIVARAIDSEMKKSGDEHVYLDATSLGSSVFDEHFPTIRSQCMAAGIDPVNDLIPVAPAAHYQCGGIQVDVHGRTGIVNLYAAGECARTGLHGANRLASNSLLEALVFANRAAMHVLNLPADGFGSVEIPDWDAEGTVEPPEQILISQTRRELQSLMSVYVGIVRSDLRLKRADERLKLLNLETEALYKRSPVSPALCELRNMINVAYLVIHAAMNRHENRGLHYNIDRV